MYRERFAQGLLCLLTCSLATVHAAPPSTAETDPASDRLTFLTLRLSSAEESLKAIDGALRIAGYKARVAGDKAAGYEKGNELMDRKGGAPVPWDQFYGKTARSFATKWNDPIRRPKQFDFLYRANNEQAAKAKDEVAAMGQRIDALLARRRQLELERITLWTTIAMESISNREISFKPLYRLQLTTAKVGAATQPAGAPDPRIATLDGDIQFLKAIDASAKATEDSISNDAGKSLNTLKQAVALAHRGLQESLFNASQVGSLGAAEAQQAKRMAAIAKQIESQAQNIADAFALSGQSESAGDDARKQTLDGALQEALLGFADATGELDSLIETTASAWGLRGQPGTGQKSPEPAPAPAHVGVPAVPSPNPVTVASTNEKLAHAQMLGHGGELLVENAPAGAILAGFEFTSKRVKERGIKPKDIVSSARAIYRGPAGDVLGKQLGKPAGDVTRIVARPGYGVAAISGAMGARHIFRVTLHFVRIDGAAAIPTDTYDGPAYGMAVEESTIIGASRPVIGIRVSAGDNLDSIELISAP